MSVCDAVVAAVFCVVGRGVSISALQVARPTASHFTSKRGLMRSMQTVNEAGVVDGEGFGTWRRRRASCGAGPCRAGAELIVEELRGLGGELRYARHHRSAAPARARPEIMRPFQAVMILSSRCGRGRLLRAASKSVSRPLSRMSVHLLRRHLEVLGGLLGGQGAEEGVECP